MRYRAERYTLSLVFFFLYVLFLSFLSNFSLSFGRCRLGDKVNVICAVGLGRTESCKKEVSKES